MLKLFLSFLLLASCAATEPLVDSNLQSEERAEEIQKDSIAQEYNVQFTALQHHPYCGGAAPSEDQLNLSSQVHGGLLLINLETKEKSPLRANDEGLFQLMLPPGKYAIKEEFKDIPFEQFVQQHKKEGMYLIPGTDECYKKWWSGYLGEFEINENVPPLNFDYSLRNSCFTGNNPCDIYTGPYPP